MKEIHIIINDQYWIEVITSEAYVDKDKAIQKVKEWNYNSQLLDLKQHFYIKTINLSNLPSYIK